MLDKYRLFCTSNSLHNCFIAHPFLRWQYTGGELGAENQWVPMDLVYLDEMHRDQIKIHVDGMPLHDFRGLNQPAYDKLIPCHLLSSLKLAHPEPPLTTRAGPLKQFLLSCQDLEVFHYRDHGQGTSFGLHGNERLPAFTELSLKSYNWHHSLSQVRRNWNFTRIKSLELLSVPLYNFLGSVMFEDFSGLQKLHVDDYSTHLKDRKQEATSFLYLMVKNHIKALEVLDITCHTRLFLLDAIIMHRESLQVLRFRDHVGFEDETRQCPTFCALDVQLLSKHLKYVHTLELDMDASQCVIGDFLRALCGFKSLHTLSLHVQTALRADDATEHGMDRDYEATMQILHFLAQAKQEMMPPVSWKRITINVGGWKRIMLRRLGSEWRRHNENGVFAERCFVLEPNNEGQLVVREEMCAERASRVPTPELQVF